MPPRVLRYPSVPATLLSHMQAATGLPPAASARSPASSATLPGAFSEPSSRSVPV